jgi:hypothetical protein
VPVIATMVAQATGVTIDRVAPMTFRPPVRPILLDVLAHMGEEDPRGDENSEKGEP